jgi:HEPN superfamily AbiU2-like protein
MISIKDSADFERLLKGLSDDVVDAHIHYHLYQDLIEAISKHPLVVQQSNVFWTFTLQAHLSSSIYALFRAYDQDTKSLHLRSWLTTIQANLHLFDEAAFRDRLKDNPHVANLAKDSRMPDAAMLAGDIGSCSSSDPIVKRLVAYRGSRIAHRNAKSLITARNVADGEGLTFEDVKTLLERAITILNRYSYLFSASFYSTKVVGRDDYEYIFQSVEEKVELARRQWMPQA